MKFNVTFKCPDAVDIGLERAVANSLRDDGLGEEDWHSRYESKMEEARRKIERWVNYRELLTVQFDLEAGTATVVEN